MIQYLVLTGQVKGGDLFLMGVMILVMAGLGILAVVYTAMSLTYDWAKARITTKTDQENDPHPKP